MGLPAANPVSITTPIAPLSVKVACKICGADAPFFGDVDFSKSTLPAPQAESGIPIAYYRCGHCEFLFTNAFDAWSSEDYAREIYNADYGRVDPEFAVLRPNFCAQVLSELIAPRKGTIRLMDYGGGQGAFARRMQELGFETYSYDPFFQDEKRDSLSPPDGERFELINCREVIEHAPDPNAFVDDLLRFLADDGAVFLSTGTQPPDILEIGLDWHYAAPRNGHISLFSQKSLDLLWTKHDLRLGFYNENAQLAWRGNPACLSTLMIRTS